MDITFPSGSQDTMPRPQSVITFPVSASNKTKCGIAKEDRYCKLYFLYKQYNISTQYRCGKES